MSVRTFSEDPSTYLHDGFVKQPGAFSPGVVMKANRKSDKKVRLARVFRLRNASDMELICREVAAQRALDGCRYVALWDEEIAFNPQRRQVTLLLDDYPQGYLHNYIKSATTFIRKNWVACIMNCLCAGLLDCHEKGIYHKDIRPENVLLVDRPMDGFTLKLAYLTNFGLGTMSKVAASWPSDESKDASAIADAHCYMAHETLADLSNPVFNAKTDVFSLGCTFYEILSRTKAYTNRARVSVPVLPANAKNYYGNSVTPMPSQLMDPDPDRRPDMETFAATMQTYCQSRYQKFMKNKAGDKALMDILKIAGVGLLTAHCPPLGPVIKAVMMPKPPAPAPAQPTARELPQAMSPDPRQISPKLVSEMQPAPRAPGLSPEQEELFQALLKLRGHAGPLTQPIFQQPPQSEPPPQYQPAAQPSGPSPGVALGAAVLTSLLTGHAHHPHQQHGEQTHHLAGLASGWVNDLSQALRAPPAPAHSFHVKPHAHAGAHYAQPQPAVTQFQAPAANQDQASKWSTFNTLNNNINHNAEIGFQMNAQNDATMRNVISMDAAQYEQELDNMLQNQAWGQAEQGNPVAVFPYGSPGRPAPDPHFYGGV